MIRNLGILAGTLIVSTAVAAPPAPKVACPAASSSVELPAPPEKPGAGEARVLRCLDGNGQPTGPEVWVRANGFFAQRGTWLDAAKHGLWERWYVSGHLMSQYTYQAGQVVSSRCLNEKRVDITCTADLAPRDWQPPGAAPTQAPIPTPTPAPASTPTPAPLPSPPPAPPMPTRG